MKIDLGQKIGEVKDMPVMGAIGSNDEEAHYPCGSLHNLPEGVKGLEVGSTVMLQAKITLVTESEDGISDVSYHVLSVDDGKKTPSPKKNSAKDDMEAIDKGLEESDDYESDEEND